MVILTYFPCLENLFEIRLIWSIVSDVPFYSFQILQLTASLFKRALQIFHLDSGGKIWVPRAELWIWLSHILAAWEQVNSWIKLSFP